MRVEERRTNVDGRVETRVRDAVVEMRTKSLHNWLYKEIEKGDLSLHQASEIADIVVDLLSSPIRVNCLER